MDIRMQARVYQPGGPRLLEFIMHVPAYELDDFLPNISPEQLEEVLNSTFETDTVTPQTPSLPKAALEQVAPRIRYSQYKNKHGTALPQCAICLETIHSGTRRYIRTLPCGHTYCANCIDNWVTKHSATCPACREVIQQHS